MGQPGPAHRRTTLSGTADGADYLVRQALEAVRPRVLAIEDNSALPPRTRRGCSGTR